MTTIDPLLIKFTHEQRDPLREIRVEHGIPEARFIKAGLRYIIRNPRLFQAVLKEALAEKKEVVK